MTWGGLLRSASLGVGGSLLFLVVVAGVTGSGADPFLVIIGLLFAFGPIWQARWRGGATYIVVLCVLWFLLSIVFGGFKALARPASWAEFVVVVASVVFPAVAVYAYRGVRRAGSSTPHGTRVLRLAFGVLGLALVVGLGATLITKSDTARAGDIRVVAKRFVFAPTSLKVRAGTVSVIVHNEDASHHDFTIEGVVAVQVPSFHARRATFTLLRGTYTYECVLHDGMTGTLTAS